MIMDQRMTVNIRMEVIKIMIRNISMSKKVYWITEDKMKAELIVNL